MIEEIYVNWETHEVLTYEQFYEKIEEHVTNYYDSALFEEWIDNNYDASEVVKMHISDIIEAWREYVEGVYCEEYEEIKLEF